MNLWEKTLKQLVSVLDTTGNDCQKIRLDLERIQKDLVSTKASIEAMVAKANGEYEATRRKLQQNLDDANRKVEQNNSCFKDAGRALATIFSFGISCAVQDGVLQ